MRIPIMCLLFTALLKTGCTDVIFTRERCDRKTYGLREQPGDPHKYRQCGPNNRVWVVPCVSRSLFDPVNKVCKEQSHIYPLLSVRRKSGKSVEAREREGTKLQPLTEEFLFSTKKPKNTRPRIKPTSTAASSTSSSSTNLPSLTKTVGRFPTPPPLDYLSTTTLPFIPAMEITQEISSPPTVTPSMAEMGPLGSPGPLLTPARSNTAPPLAHTVSYKGITMSEEEFLKQLVRIVEAHQLAISKIKEQVEQERLREKTEDSKNIAENYGEKYTAGNQGGKATQTNAKELEKQHSVKKQPQKEKEELEWQEELAKQKSAEEELKNQQEYAEKLAKSQHLKKMLAWQRELALKKAELEKKEKELAERQRQVEEKLRREEAIRKEKELQKLEKEKRRQLELQEKRKHEQEMKKQELARQKEELEKKKKEKQEKARILAEQKKQKENKEQEAKRQLSEMRKAEEERKSRERQQELARLKAERLQREKEEEERKKLEEEHLIEVERIRLEMEKEMEEEARRMAVMAASEERNGSSSDKSRFRIHNSDEHMKGGNSEHTAHENKVIEAVMSGLMASKSVQTTMEPEVEIMRFTPPPPTPSSPGNEWVTSPHSWRPTPDVQTNQLEWSQSQIPSTGTSELPSVVIPKCSLTHECNFNYDEDLLCPHPSSPNLYLQCTPWIGMRGRWAERMCPPNLVFMPYYGRCGLDVEASFTHQNTVIPRLPSDPEFIQWKGNKEIQQNIDTTQTPYSNYLVTEEFLQPTQMVTRKPIYKIIEEFPQDLLPSSDVQNSFFPVVYEPNETPTDLGPTLPLFPMIEPHFLVPFEKFQDEFSEDTSFIGSIVKPAVKKIALDQAETFLDRILSDDVESRGESSTHSVSTLSSEDGWR